MRYLMLSLFACLYIFILYFPVNAETLETFPESNKTELRDIALGMHIKDLPKSHFKNFNCAKDKKELSKLEHYSQCSAEQGLYEIGLEFDTTDNEWAKANDNLEGTTVAGYPVILSILIDKQSLIQGIRAFTDPKARSYLKRQAYLLSKRIKSHYGSNDWQCSDREPGTDGHQPFGPVFIDQRCIKLFSDKKVAIESKFYITPKETGKEFTNYSSMEILSLLATSN